MDSLDFKCICSIFNLNSALMLKKKIFSRNNIYCLGQWNALKIQNIKKKNTMEEKYSYSNHGIQPFMTASPTSVRPKWTVPEGYKRKYFWFSIAFIMHAKDWKFELFICLFYKSFLFEIEDFLVAFSSHSNSTFSAIPSEELFPCEHHRPLQVSIPQPAGQWLLQ